MRLDDVHQDAQAGVVGGVNELFEVVGGAKTGRSGEEVGNVIAERSVVGVFHDAHELDGVVSGSFDARDDILGELFVAADAFGFLGHADVGFIDKEVVEIFLAAVFEPLGIGPLEAVFVRPVPNFAEEIVGVRFLLGPEDIEGDSVLRHAIVDDADFDARAMREEVFVQGGFPAAVRQAH